AVRSALRYAVPAILALALAAAGAAGPEERRGAGAAERAAVSRPEWIAVARAGVREWGAWRLVFAEDPFNCAGDWCPFALLDRSGAVRVEGVALVRPRIEGERIVWIAPGGGRMEAKPIR
ncbi:MAG: hypothetical protein OXI01_12635, partial [Albidovulum sp.]|nr:hypothetical protein [Albidovulum sp.]